ncbi:MAG: hypothetical protein EOO52_00170 [Gammaproteobacteria bacterium]|nr:MAG: hypothetical protein EOO52_00170 [Gammaproteobacteria bacterium]
MSRISIKTYEPNDFFSRQTLELTFRLLRNNNPGLSNAIKNAMSHVNIVHYETIRGIHTGEMHFNVDIYQLLTAHTIGQIVYALTKIGELALAKHDMPPEHINQLRKLIEDWVQLTEWVLYQTTTDKTAYH